MTPGIYKKGEKDDNPEARDDLVHDPLTLPNVQDELDLAHFSFAGHPQFVWLHDWNERMNPSREALESQHRLYWILVRRSWPPG